MITRAGAAFGSWYTDAEFTGDRIFTVPSDAAAGTTYYARWIYYSFDFVNFDSYNTDSDMTAVWLNWGRMWRIIRLTAIRLMPLPANQ